MNGKPKIIPAYVEREYQQINAIRFDPAPVETYWRAMWFGDLVYRLPLAGDNGYVPTVKRVQEVCAKFFQIPFDDLIGRRRDAETCEARDIAICLCREVGGRTFTEIGRRFHRDHSSVMSAMKRLKIRFRSDPVLVSRFNDVRMRL